MPRSYTRRIDILVLCTANQCRSPMAEVLLGERLRALGVEASVRSAGELAGGVAASGGSVRSMAARGLDLTGHRSQTLTPEALAGADLVITMARRHLRHAVAMRPEIFGRTFTLKELVRRAASVGRRRPEEPIADWLARVHHGRTPSSLLGDDRDDDVSDPMGGPDARYEQTAVELETLVDHFCELALAAPLPTGRETA